MASIIKYSIKNEYDLDRLKEIWTPLEAGEDMTTIQTLEWNRLLIKEWEGWQLHALYSEVYVYAAFEGRKPVMLLPVIVYTMTTSTKWFGSRKGGLYPGPRQLFRLHDAALPELLRGSL